MEYKQKNVIYSCVAYKPDTRHTIYAVGNDKYLKEINNGNVVPPAYENS
jgi:hypothetical protein